ncbi:glycosyltransferase family 2 protein [Maribacter sp. 2307ULW6-5]|uniref:glycosyltransferase family 2 protein n=1 Tax=Maribacter sp. 2307ULW6-5 TaxID=3386275 RepID=UPI0039BCD9B8
MYHIAVLLTCFNRREKTLKALSHLFAAQEKEKDQIALNVYLTDDGCSDGTAEAVAKMYPETKILQGTGDLYWAGGMRNSWQEALKGDHDAYLLLNDDTNMFANTFTDFLSTHKYCLKEFKKGGIYCGATLDGETQNYSYGGHVFTNKFLARYIKVVPNGVNPQSCELGNANIMWVSKNVVDTIGILSDEFVHGLADFDYTLMAKKKNLPVLLAPHYLGNCSNDHTNPYIKFPSLSFKERLKMLYSPLSLDFKSNLAYNRRNFPLRLPIVFLVGYLKVLFPSLYVKRHKL